MNRETEPAAPRPPRSGYGPVERALHRLAFAAIGPQRGLADLEDRLYARRLAGVAVERPVFVTSLPRAGTTLLLQTLASLDAFVSHTYRDLPFLLAPLLWDALSRPFRAANALRPRAHGDGMPVGHDSPEAFEEILWRVFWPGKYRGDRIEPWRREDRAPGFEAFLRSHLRKMVALRAGPGCGGVRYLSKNNANLARLPTILRMFPDATVLVPFREPLAQAASLLRTHRVFLEIHARDPFARRYMNDLGHHEFGANLRPLDFDGRLSEEARESPHTIGFWLQYWCAAFAQALEKSTEDSGNAPPGRVAFLSYDRACAEPRKTLARLGERLGLTDRETRALVSRAGEFRRPAAPETAGQPSPALEARAREIHEELLRRSLC